MRNIFVILILPVLFFAGTCLFLTSALWFNLNEIVLSGDGNLSLNEVIKLSPIVLGTNIFRIDTGKIENDIKEDLTLSWVKVTRKLPDKIEIQLQRKKPIFLINLDRLYGLTRGKEIIPLKGSNGKLNLPILSGIYLNRINFYREVDTPEIQRAVDFYQAVLEADSTFLDKISELNLSSQENLVLYLLPSGLRVMMGKDHYKSRIARLMAILETEDDLERFSWVDLRFKNQGIVRNKKS